MFSLLYKCYGEGLLMMLILSSYGSELRMCKYEWYVVVSKHPNKLALENLQKDLCKKYGGLTILKNCEGLWVNHAGNIDADKVEIWRVLTDKIVLPSEAIKIGEQLKAICQQESQLFTVNDNPYFV